MDTEKPSVKNRINLRDMTKMALCVALLCVSSYLVIALPFTPIVLSMHTVMVNLVGLILKPKHAACAITLYLIMGLAGLPVFSAGTAGPGKLFGPTGGFYFGFLLAAVAISLARGSKPNFIRYSAAAILLGIPLQHVMAILFMCFYNGFDIAAAAATVSLPFIPGDVIKCFMAAGIGIAINKALEKMG